MLYIRSCSFHGIWCGEFHGTSREFGGQEIILRLGKSGEFGYH